jgi:dihydrofolate reductase
MPRFRAYLALSVDGYIADADGGVGWLNPYFSPDLGFHEFIGAVGATVMGRVTYDQAVAMGRFQNDSPRTIVMTHRPIDDLPGCVEIFDGALRGLADRLRAELEAEGKDIWLMGGGSSIQAWHEAGLVDSWELYVIPVTLGAGVPLFPSGSAALSELKLVSARSFESGIVELKYEPRDTPTPERSADGA